MKKTLISLVILSLVISSSPVLAGETAPESIKAAAAEPAVEKAAPPAAPEKEYTPKLADKDPFKTLISPPPAQIAPQEKPLTVIPEKEKIVEPLPIKVTFIVGTDMRRFANLVLNRKTYEMTNGEDAEGGLFHVIEVGDRSVKIFDSRVKKERTINLVE